jgi:DedD protein
MADHPDSNIDLKRRARRRLVGALALVLLVVIVLPLVLDREPRPLSQELSVLIPSQDAGRFNSRALPPGAPVQEAQQGNAAVPSSQPVRSAAPVTPAATSTPSPAIAPSATPAPVPASPLSAMPLSAAPAPVPAPAPSAAAGSATASAPTPPVVASGKAERYLVQIGAYSTTLNAKRAQDKANAAGFKTIVEVAQGPKGEQTKVRAGPYATREAAEKAREELKTLGLPVGSVVPQ